MEGAMFPATRLCQQMGVHLRKQRQERMVNLCWRWRDGYCRSARIWVSTWDYPNYEEEIAIASRQVDTQKIMFNSTCDDWYPFCNCADLNGNWAMKVMYTTPDIYNKSAMSLTNTWNHIIPISVTSFDPRPFSYPPNNNASCPKPCSVSPSNNA